MSRDNTEFEEIAPLDGLCRQAIDSTNLSSVAVDELRSSPSQEAAEKACSACRKAVQLVFFARHRLGGRLDKLIQQLDQDVNTAVDLVSELSNSNTVSDVVGEYVANLNWRLDLLSAMRKRDKQRISQLTVAK